jgi:PTS system nitrogen regulatory IIA component
MPSASLLAPQQSSRRTRITDVLRPEAVIADLAGRTAEAVLAELCRPLGRAADLQQVLLALLEREELGSTGIGDGVAIPHARIAGLPRLTASFGRSRIGLDFGAIDRRPCHFFFALFVPTERVGVRIVGVQVGGVQFKALARVSALFSEPAFRDAVLEARDAARIHRLFMERDDEDAS